MKSATFSLLTSAGSRRSEQGTGIIGTMFGALVFLSFVGLSAHTLVGLYASSVVKTVTWDGATRVANQPDDLELANAELDRRLRGMHVLSREWDVADPAAVRLHVEVERPGLLPHSLARATSLTTIDHTAVVRREVIR